MLLQELIALTAFVAIGSGSPGPNNTLLLASGVAFGFRRTVPHVVGTSIGIVALVGIAAAGAGVVVTALPQVQLALKLAASAYLVYLAMRLASGVTLDGATAPRPLTVVGAMGFQFVNPKGWAFALALAAAFAPTSDAATLATGLTVAIIVSAIVALTAAAWAYGGASLSRLLETDRARRLTGIILALALLGSIAFLWV